VPSGDAFRTLFAPEICRTLIDSDIVALSAADVLKLYAKASETEDVSAKAFAKDATNVSLTEAVSAAGFAKEAASASDIEVESATALPKL
jgi:hypothetical protein